MAKEWQIEFNSARYEMLSQGWTYIENGECCRAERSKNTGASWFRKNHESGGECGEEGFWIACLHWEGDLVQILGHHDAAGQVVGETTLFCISGHPTTGRMSLGWKGCRRNSSGFYLCLSYSKSLDSLGLYRRHLIYGLLLWVHIKQHSSPVCCTVSEEGTAFDRLNFSWTFSETIKDENILPKNPSNLLPCLLKHSKIALGPVDLSSLISAFLSHNSISISSSKWILLRHLGPHS